MDTKDTTPTDHAAGDEARCVCGHPWRQHESHGCVAPECYRATRRCCTRSPPTPTEERGEGDVIDETRTDAGRGLVRYVRLRDNRGTTVRVQSSSSAEEPAVWIFAKGGDGKDDTPHLNVKQARAVASALLRWADDVVVAEDEKTPEGPPAFERMVDAFLDIASDHGRHNRKDVDEPIWAARAEVRALFAAGSDLAAARAEINRLGRVLDDTVDAKACEGARADRAEAEVGRRIDENAAAWVQARADVERLDGKLREAAAALLEMLGTMKAAEADRDAAIKERDALADLVGEAIGRATPLHAGESLGTARNAGHALIASIDALAARVGEAEARLGAIDKVVRGVDDARLNSVRSMRDAAAKNGASDVLAREDAECLDFVLCSMAAAQLAARGALETAERAEKALAAERTRTAALVEAATRARRGHEDDVAALDAALASMKGDGDA